MKISFYTKSNRKYDIPLKIFTTEKEIINSFIKAQLSITRDKKAMFVKIAKALYENNELENYEEFAIDKLKYCSKSEDDNG